jgi:hypothetical protein
MIDNKNDSKIDFRLREFNESRNKIKNSMNIKQTEKGGLVRVNYTF